MNLELIRELLKKKKIPNKPVGTQLCIKCPDCGRQKMYINMDEESPKKGLWDCKICHTDGNYYSLFTKLGEDYKDHYKPKTESGKYRLPRESYLDVYRKNLANCTEAKDYLTKVRRFSREACLEFKLGVKVDDNDRVWIATPHFVKGTVVNYKYRSIDGDKEFRREEGCESVLYGLDQCDPKKSIVLAEGEWERIGAYMLGVTNVATTTTGAGGFDSKWIADLKGFKEIILCYDADGKGRMGAEKVSKMLGRHRCKYVQLPFDDICHCLEVGMTPDEFQELLGNAKHFELDEIKHMSDLEKEFDTEFSNKEANIGIPTGYTNIDGMLRGIRMGELTIVTGHTAQGKTTWTTALARNLVENTPVLIASFEMKKGKIFKKLIQMYAERPYEDLTPEEYISAKERVFESDLYILDKFGDANLKDVKEIVEYGRYKNGIKVFIFDHLEFISNSGADNNAQNETNTMKVIKRLTIDYDCHIILIAHPHKTESDKPIRLVDIKGASSIYQIADNFLSVFINPQRREYVTIGIEKNREYGDGVGDCIFRFNIGKLEYKEVEGCG